MLIILEGPDGAGKTTLAEQLAIEITRRTRVGSVVVMHKGPPTEKNLLAEYLLPLADYVPGVGRHVICDRWHLGELVYPKLIGRPELIHEWSEFSYLEMFLQSRGAIIVHVSAEEPVLRGRIADRDLSLDYEHRVREQRIAFFETFRKTRLHSVTYHSSSFHANDIRHFIVDRATHLEDVVTFLARYPTYVGPTKPLYLLIGDQRGRLYPEYPVAFAPVPGTSGHYLLRALENHMMRSVGIVNANEDDVQMLWGLLNSPYAVALGHRAAEATHTMRSVRGIVPHPQFIRRFHHAALTDYGAAITQAAKTGEDMLKWRP